MKNDSIKIDPELKALIPPLQKDEYEKLQQSILSEGCRDALVLWNDTIIDGHNRYYICTENDIPFETVQREFDSRDDVKIWMITNQLARRNLTNFVRAELALQMKDVISQKAKANLKTPTGNKQSMTLENYPKSLNRIDTRLEVAKIGNVSDNTIQRVEKILDKADESTKQKLRDGEISVNRAYQDIKKEEKKQERHQQRAELIKKADESITPNDIEIRYGAFQDVLSDIEDNSVDAIITDPPYPKEFLHLWSELGEFALRVLKPGGFLVSYSGQLYLPSVMESLGKHLEYYWLGGLYHPGIQAQRFERKIQNAMKPILIYNKPLQQKQTQWFVDLVESPKKEKSMHDWQQSIKPFEYLIDRFTSPGDLVVEPFAGGGTTLLACHNKKRRCIGAEIDQQSYKLTVARLNDVVYDKKI